MAQAQEVFLFNPTSITGCQLWLDGADPNGNGIVPSNGATISTWVDKSGSQYNFTANSTGLTYASNAILFVDNNYMINASITTFQNANTLFLVLKATGINSSGIGMVFTYGSDVNTDPYGYRILAPGIGTSTSYSWDVNPPGNGGNIDYAGNATLYVNGVTGTSNTYSIYNQSILSAPGNGGVGAGNPLLVGLTLSRTFNNRYYNGYNYETILYNSKLTTSQRQQVEGYLAWKWGLQASLPATHPFRNYRPLANAPIPTSVPNMPIRTQGTLVFNPRSVTGINAWYDGADPLGTGVQPTFNTALTTWFDKSGNRRNASGGTPATFVNGGVSFNGTSQYYTMSIPYSSNYSIFLVATNTTVPQCYYFGRNALGGGRDPTFIQGYIGAGIGLEWFEGSDRGTIATTPVSPFIASVDHTQGTSIQGYYYGTQSFNIAQTRAYSGFAWDTLGQAGETVNVGWYGGTMKELIFYSNVVTTNQRQNIEGYLAWKWNLTSSLPSGHPYKTAPIAPFPFRAIPFNGSLGQWQPNRISGLSLWLDGADPNANGSVPSNGATVSTWVDKSGNGLTVSGASSQPTYTQNVSGRLGALSFNGSQGLSRSSVLASSMAGNNTTTFSAFVIGSYSNTTQRSIFYTWFGNVAESIRILLQYDGTGNHSFDFNDFPYRTNIGSFTPANNTLLLYSGVRNGGTGTLNINGGTNTATSTGLTTTNFGSTSATLNIGRYPTDTSWNMRGNIGEIVFYNSALSAFQRQQVEGYLAWKWGLQGSLPGNHPYKLFPPSP